MRKKADPNLSFFQTMKGMAKQPSFIAAMLAPVAGFAVGRGEDWVTNRRNAEAKTTAYKEMLDLHPHLRERDQNEVSRIYNSLHNASPNMARDPMVAGAWVDEIIENKTPGMNSHHALLNAVKDLSGIQKNLTDIEHNRRGRTLAPLLERKIEWAGGEVEKFRKDNVEQHIKQVHEENAKVIAEREAHDLLRDQKLREWQQQLEHAQHENKKEYEALRKQRFDTAVADYNLENRWLKFKQSPLGGGKPPQSSKSAPSWMNEGAGVFRRKGPPSPHEGSGQAASKSSPTQYLRRKTSSGQTELRAMLRALRV